MDTHRVACILEELPGELHSLNHAGRGLEVPIPFTEPNTKRLCAGVNLREGEPRLHPGGEPDWAAPRDQGVRTSLWLS